MALSVERAAGEVTTVSSSPPSTARDTKAGGGTNALFCRVMCEVAVGSDQRPRAATARSSIFAPNGSAPAWKVSRAGALAGSENCRRHQSLIPA